MTVAVGLAVNNDGDQQSVETLEWMLKRVTEDRDKLRMVETTKGAFTRMNRFSTKLSGVTHKIRTQQLKIWKGKRTLANAVATSVPLKPHKSPIAYRVPCALVRHYHITHHSSHIVTKEAEHHNEPDGDAAAVLFHPRQRTLVML